MIPRLPCSRTPGDGPRTASGLSLIELLIALALGAMLVLAVTAMFLASRKTAALENSLATLQENARTALKLLRRDLLRAGYLGCNTGEVLFVDMLDNDGIAGAATPVRALRVYARRADGRWDSGAPAVTELDWTRAGNTERSGGARNGSDVLKLRLARKLQRAGVTAPLLRTPVSPGDGSLLLEENPGCAIRRNSHVVLTGCGPSAHLFQVSNAPSCTAASASPGTVLEAGPPNIINTFNAAYSRDSELLLAEEVVWFIAASGRERAGQTVWALFRDVRGDGRGAQEIVDGVEHLQIQLSERLDDGRATRLVSPGSAVPPGGAGEDSTEAVRIGLLLQRFAATRHAADERTYTLVDERVVPPALAATGQGAVHGAGPVLRAVVSMTVSHRNAAFPRDATQGG